MRRLSMIPLLEKPYAKLTESLQTKFPEKRFFLNMKSRSVLNIEHLQPNLLTADI